MVFVFAHLLTPLFYNTAHQFSGNKDLLFIQVDLHFVNDFFCTTKSDFMLQRRKLYPNGIFF